MTFKYKKEFFIIIGAFGLCISLFGIIKLSYFQDASLSEPLDNVVAYYREGDITHPVATTKPYVTSSAKRITTVANANIDEMIRYEVPEENYEFPYEVAPTFKEDGSIIYDGLTMTELTDKLNKSLNSYMTNTGYFFAKYTRDTGLDPYLSVAIVLLETGCKWQCSTLAVECNNIGGLKGGNSCRGGSYRKYDTLKEGIEGYLNIIYNNYYLKGMKTAEEMARTYAASSEWPNKVNTYIAEIKAK